MSDYARLELTAFEDEPLSSRPGITVALVLLGVVVGLVVYLVVKS